MYQNICEKAAENGVLSTAPQTRGPRRFKLGLAQQSDSPDEGPVIKCLRAEIVQKDEFIRRQAMDFTNGCELYYRREIHLWFGWPYHADRCQLEDSRTRVIFDCKAPGLW
jgi:hypothetical protein